MSQSNPKRRRLVPILALALLTSVLAMASPAEARTWTNKSKPFHRSSTIHFADIDVCARVYVSGTITYRKYTSTRQTRYNDVKVNNPRVAVVTYDRTGSTCTWTRKTVGQVRIVQRWSGYSCSFDPSISVSWPWGVSVSGWAGCGNERQANRQTNYYSDTSYYSQSNSGAPVTFGNVTYGQNNLNAKPCYGVYAGVTIWNRTGNSSDFNNSAKKKICLS